MLLFEVSMTGLSAVTVSVWATDETLIGIATVCSLPAWAWTCRRVVSKPARRDSAW